MCCKQRCEAYPYTLFHISTKHCGDRTSESIRIPRRSMKLSYEGERVQPSGPGMPRERLAEVRVDYPSIKPIKQFCDSDWVRMFSVSIPDRRGRGEGHFLTIVCCDGLLDTMPSAYVINWNYSDREHTHLWKSIQIPGTTRDSFWVCDGSYYGRFQPIYNGLEKDPIIRVLAYLSHIFQVLNDS